MNRLEQRLEPVHYWLFPNLSALVQTAVWDRDNCASDEVIVQGWGLTYVLQIPNNELALEAVAAVHSD